MKVNRPIYTVTFDSTEELLDAFVALSVRLSEFGSETADDPIKDVPYLQARKLLWESGFSLQRLLRHELLLILGEKGERHIQYKCGHP